jgi:hypothetical protein
MSGPAPAGRLVPVDECSAQQLFRLFRAAAAAAAPVLLSPAPKLGRTRRAWAGPAMAAALRGQLPLAFGRTGQARAVHGPARRKRRLGAEAAHDCDAAATPPLSPPPARAEAETETEVEAEAEAEAVDWESMWRAGCGPEVAGLDCGGACRYATWWRAHVGNGSLATAAPGTRPVDLDPYAALSAALSRPGPELFADGELAAAAALRAECLAEMGQPAAAAADYRLVRACVPGAEIRYALL